MEFILYNKHHPLCHLSIDNEGFINKIFEIYDEKYAPVGVSLTNKNSLYEWWKGRSIPASRAGLSKILMDFNMSSANILPLKSLGLSLSDQYWIKPYGSDITWEQVNFFDNPFSKDIGEAFFNPDFQKKHIDFMSPDNTSDGWLKKKWVITSNKRCLVKTGSDPYKQEPFNEVIASKIMEKLNIGPYVKYGIFVDAEQGPCSICENFITRDTELVSGFSLYKAYPKANETSLFQHFIDVADKLDIPNMQEALENFIVLDYIIANTDRHAGNFGFIRDVNTLKYIGAAPIYDNGTSLWYNSIDKLIGRPIKSQPFNASPEEQLKLVKNWHRFDFSKLDTIQNDIKQILSGNSLITKARARAICNAVKERIAYIKLYQFMATSLLPKEELHSKAVKEFKTFKINTSPIFIYYKDLYVEHGKNKYNPSIDKNILTSMLKDGFTTEQSKAILLNSPNLKSEKMVEILCKSVARQPAMKKYFANDHSIDR